MMCELTLAGLDALDPSVLKLGVAGSSAFLEPSTAAKTTTPFAGLFAQTTLGALRTACRGCASRRGRFSGHATIWITQDVHTRMSGHKSACAQNARTGGAGKCERRAGRTS